MLRATFNFLHFDENRFKLPFSKKKKNEMKDDVEGPNRKAARQTTSSPKLSV